MAFHAHASNRRCKAVAPDGSFLLLVFPSGTGSRQPDLFEALVDAPHGLPLLPHDISLEVPAGAPHEQRSGDAAASRIPSPHASSVPQEVLVAALVERSTLTHCLSSTSSTPAAAPPPATSAAEGSRGSSPGSAGRCATGAISAMAGARTSLATWQSDPPLSVPPANQGATHQPVPAVPAQGAPAAASGSSGRSSSMSQVGSRATSRSALAAWSREFAPHGQGSGSGLRTGTPVGDAAPAVGPRGHSYSQNLVTPRLPGFHPAAPQPHQPAGTHLAAPSARGGMPVVPAPSPMVANSLHGYTQQGRPDLGQGAPTSVKDPDVRRITARWGAMPAASVTGTGPLSLGSLPPVGATPSQFTAASAGHAAMRSECTTALLPPPRDAAGGVAGCEDAVAATAAPLPTSALPPGMPEWLTSAVGRHPELAVLLERNNIEQAADDAAEPVGEQVENSAAREPVAGQPKVEDDAGQDCGRQDPSRAAIKRQRDGDEGHRSGDEPGGGGAAADDADTAVLAALLDGDAGSNAAEGEAEMDGSLHAALAPGGMSEAELAAMATRSPSHASPVRRPADGTGVASTRMPAEQKAVSIGAEATAQATEQPVAQGESQECPLTPRHPRGPSEPHRAVKSPRVCPAALGGHPGPFHNDRSVAGAQPPATAVGVPAVGQAVPGAVMHASASEALSHLMPMPALQCADPEASAALAPLYSYISRLQRHIEVLQAQLHTGHVPPLPHVQAQLVQRLQAGGLQPGLATAPFPGAPCAVPHTAAANPTAPDSPPAMQPASIVTGASALAGPHQRRVTSSAAADSTGASPVQHAFKVVRASGRHSAVSPSVDPLQAHGEGADGDGTGGQRDGTRRPQQQEQRLSPERRGRRADRLRDSLEAVAASFLMPGRDASEQAPASRPAAAGEALSDQYGRRPARREGAAQQAQRDGASLHHLSQAAHEGSERSEILASWPAQRELLGPGHQSRASSRAPSRQLTGAMFGGSPDKVFSTDELKAAVAAAEAAAEAAGGGSAVPSGRAAMSEDVADAIVDSFLVASHSPTRSPGKVDRRRSDTAAGRGAVVRTSLSSKRRTDVRPSAEEADWDTAAGGAAEHTDDTARAHQSTHGRGRDGGGGQGSPALLRRRRPGRREEATGARSRVEPAPVAAAASALDASSVCPETEAPSTPAALSHGRTQGGSTASVAARGDRAPHGGRSPGCIPVRQLVMVSCLLVLLL